jgi:hypothetical protein
MGLTPSTTKKKNKIILYGFIMRTQIEAVDGQTHMYTHTHTHKHTQLNITHIKTNKAYFSWKSFCPTQTVWKHDHAKEVSIPLILTPW